MGSWPRVGHGRGSGQLNARAEQASRQAHRCSPSPETGMASHARDEFGLAQRNAAETRAGEVLACVLQTGAATCRL